MRKYTIDRAGPKFYTIEQIGENRALTPEGFLLCTNVPIGRTGSMQYLGDGYEVPIASTAGSQGIVLIDREAGEVFRPETLASFAGKPVTFDHPGEAVSPETYRLWAVGTVLDPRRGAGHQNDLMLADFLITDPDIIKAILDGEISEVSSGYDCDYEEIGPGRGRQVNIIGNHVALVDKGRCGPRCAIGDHEMKRREIAPTVRQLLGRGTALDAATAVKALRAAYITKDEEAFQNALAEVISGDEEMEVHANGELEEIQELLGELCADADERAGCTTGDAGICTVMKDGKIKDSYKKSMDRRMKDRKVRDEEEAKKKEEEEKAAADKRMRDAANGQEESEEEENSEERREERAGDKKGKGKDAAMTTDSSALESIYRETLSYAEILAPGIKFPTFDKRAQAKLTQDALCMLRRRSLEKALANDDTAPIIRSFTGDSPGIKDLKCADVETMFRGAAELVKQHNTHDAKNGIIKRIDNHLSFGGQMKMPTIAEINKRNREFYGNKK